MPSTEERTFNTLRRLRPANVVYERGETSSEPIAAIRGLIETDQHPLAATVTNARTEDFIFAAEELILDEQVVEPTPGDRIRETIKSRVHLYEVIRKGDQPCWRWMGTEHHLIRVYSKLVSIT